MYATETPTNQPTRDKIAEFDRLPRGWVSSTATVLKGRLLGSSINSNRGSGVREADERQRYNYVVQELNGKNEILVATWSFAGKLPGNKVDFDVVCGPNGNIVYPNVTVESGMMVNLWPGDYPTTPAPTATSPPNSTSQFTSNACQSASFQGFRSVQELIGFMAAHSDHFMLAQGVGTTLGMYGPGTRDAWAMTSVKYAGEIIVDVQTCTYIINQGSETYTPAAGSPANAFEYLFAVAALFNEKVGASPDEVRDGRGTGRPASSNVKTVIPGCDLPP
jgi:hypothetical protein